MPDFNCNLIGIQLTLGLSGLQYFMRTLRDTPMMLVTFSISILGPTSFITAVEAAGVASDRLLENQLNERKLIKNDPTQDPDVCVCQAQVFLSLQSIFSPTFVS